LTLSILLSLLGLVVLLLLSAFFSGSETALFSLGKLRLRRMKQAGNLKAEIVAGMLVRPSRLLISILFGNMFVNILASSLATVLLVSLLAHRGEFIAFICMSAAILIFGEITPKFLAVQNPSHYSSIVASPLYLFSTAIAPLVRFLETITRSIISLLEMGRRSKAPAPTEEELLTVVELGHKEGIVDHVERQMIQRAFEFGNLSVEEVMTPRTEIFSLSIRTPPPKARALLKTRGFSRVPVYRKDPEDVVGIVYAKDLVVEMFSSPGTSLKRYLRAPYFVPESKRLGLLLREFQIKRIHIAMVIDEHGAISGLVTMEDLLEEIVGEIVDRKERPPAEYQILDRDTIVVIGSMELDDLNRIFRVKLAHPDYKTVAGYVLGQLGRVPAEGSSFDLNNLGFKVLKAEPNRIIALRIRKIRRKYPRHLSPFRRS
jgi:putative hemolysin